MDNLNLDLEELLLTQSLDNEEHDTVERALDEGYAALSAEEKSLIRRALNRNAANARVSPLQRYRTQRKRIARATLHQKQAHHTARAVQ